MLNFKLTFSLPCFTLIKRLFSFSSLSAIRGLSSVYLAAKSLQSCLILCDPRDSQAPPSLGFSRQEHWSGLPFPSPMRESEVAQLCLTPSDPMDCSLPGSSIHGVFQARGLEWGAIAFLPTLCIFHNNKSKKFKVMVLVEAGMFTCFAHHRSLLRIRGPSPTPPRSLSLSSV